MPLIDAIDQYQDARENGFALGAFDTNAGNPDFIMSILDAAEELNFPVIIQGGARPLSELYDIRAFGRSIASLAQDREAKVVLHLNMAENLDQIRTALDSGFTSVMIDGSFLDFKDNIELTRQAVEIAEVYNAAVEGKLGILGGREDLEKKVTQTFTDPEEAKTFVKETDIDIFVPSFGNVYGSYINKPNLNFNLLKTLKDSLSIGMTIHGASGLSDRDYRSLIENGAVKINISTAMRTTYLKNIKEAMEKAPKTTLSYEITASARKDITRIVVEMIRLFRGSWE
ncbi:MAG: class II fructose-bisphosphate aldolase [Deltaproteobacteria bacterium]|nr:class II fructose-bisphosphate aldolase [Candidatus Zymogenaceae bacterium]